MRWSISCQEREELMKVAGSPPGHESVHLILHQGDQGRDHHRDPLQQQRGQLVAEGFSLPRRHDHDGIVAVQGVANGLFLPRKKGGEAEMLLQRRRRSGGWIGLTWYPLEHKTALPSNG